MSSERLLRLGTEIGKTFSLNNRSSRKLLLSTNNSKSLCVAQIIRTSSLISLLLPTFEIIEFSKTLSNFVWTPKGISPISSRKRVPLFACSNFPSVVFRAPVNAPFSKPNNSASINSLGIAAQLRATKFPFRRLSSWIASATNSLPEPVGPFIITGEPEDAIKPIIFFNSTAGLDCPIILLSNDVIQLLSLLALNLL